MNILLAVDGSAPSAAAVQAVAERPWPPASTIRVLTVVETIATPPIGEMMIGAGADLDELRRQRLDEAGKFVFAVSTSLRNTGINVESAIREGSPGHEIVQEAIEWPADLIVLGSHGYTGLKRLVLGSVAGRVMSHAPCSVEVVRDRFAAEQEKHPDLELAGRQR